MLPQEFAPHIHHFLNIICLSSDDDIGLTQSSMSRIPISLIEIYLWLHNGHIILSVLYDSQCFVIDTVSIRMLRCNEVAIVLFDELVHISQYQQICIDPDTYITITDEVPRTYLHDSLSLYLVECLIARNAIGKRTYFPHFALYRLISEAYVLPTGGHDTRVVKNVIVSRYARIDDFSLIVLL